MVKIIHKQYDSLWASGLDTEVGQARLKDMNFSIQWYWPWCSHKLMNLSLLPDINSVTGPRRTAKLTREFRIYYIFFLKSKVRSPPYCCALLLDLNNFPTFDAYDSYKKNSYKKNVYNINIKKRFFFFMSFFVCSKIIKKKTYKNKYMIFLPRRRNKPDT